MKKYTVGTREHYNRTLMHMIQIMGAVGEKAPNCKKELSELFDGLQIINNEYVLKRTDFKKDDNACV